MKILQLEWCVLAQNRNVTYGKRINSNKGG